jgi:hypothetical protein
MARFLYGLSAADYLITPTGQPLPGATVTVWSALVAGAQITDMLSRDGVTPITTVTSDDEAFIAFYGPDGMFTDLFVDGGANRVAIRPINLAETLEAVNQRVVTLELQPHFQYSTDPPSDTTTLWIPSGN